GRTQSISAQNEVVLKSGNIGGLDINFNGSKLPLQGGDSEGKTLTFTPTGFKNSSRKTAPGILLLANRLHPLQRGSGQLCAEQSHQQQARPALLCSNSEPFPAHSVAN